MKVWQLRKWLEVFEPSLDDEIEVTETGTMVISRYYYDKKEEKMKLMKLVEY